MGHRWPSLQLEIRNVSKGMVTNLVGLSVAVVADGVDDDDDEQAGESSDRPWEFNGDHFIS